MLTGKEKTDQIKFVLAKYILVKIKKPFHKKRFCAAKEIRTPTPFRALPPQSSASTNFAIAAVNDIIIPLLYKTKKVFKNLLGLGCITLECKFNKTLQLKTYVFNTILKVVPLLGSEDFTYNCPL